MLHQDGGQVRRLCSSSLPGVPMPDGHRPEPHLSTEERPARPGPDAVAALLDAVVRPSPDPDAWQELRTLIDEEYGVRADFYLAEVLGKALARADPPRRDAVLDGLADLLAAHGDTLLVATL